MVNVFNSNEMSTALVFYLSKEGPDYNLSKNFVLVEMASRDGADRVLVHPALILLLQHLRDHFGRPVKILSGYRSDSHNRNVGGSTYSRHLHGMAADIQVKGVSPDEVADYLESLGVGGLGRYDTFTHVDVEGYDRRWDYRTIPPPVPELVRVQELGRIRLAHRIKEILSNLGKLLRPSPHEIILWSKHKKYLHSCNYPVTFVH